MAALSAPGIGVVWSPIAERVDPIDSVSVNGIWMEGPEERELLRWISRMTGEQETALSVPDLGRRDMHASRCQAPYEHDIGPREGIDGRRLDAAETEWTGECPVYEVVRHGPAPSEPDLRLLALREQDLKQVELRLREHPPRDFRRERATEVHQSYVGFIEIHVMGASLAESTTLVIPDDLTELGLGTAFWLVPLAAAPKVPLLGLDINLDMDVDRIEMGRDRASPNRVEVYPSTQLMSTCGHDGQERAFRWQVPRAPRASDGAEPCRSCRCARCRHCRTGR